MTIDDRPNSLTACTRLSVRQVLRPGRVRTPDLERPRFQFEPLATSGSHTLQPPTVVGHRDGPLDLGTEIEFFGAKNPARQTSGSRGRSSRSSAKIEDPPPTLSRRSVRYADLVAAEQSLALPTRFRLGASSISTSCRDCLNHFGHCRCAQPDGANHRLATALNPQPLVQHHGAPVVSCHVQERALPTRLLPSDQGHRQRARVASPLVRRFRADAADLAPGPGAHALAGHRHQAWPLEHAKVITSSIVSTPIGPGRAAKASASAC